MKTALERLLDNTRITSMMVEMALESVTEARKTAYRRGKIDVHMHLASGTVISGLRTVLKMMRHHLPEARYSPQQVREELFVLLERARALERKYPGLDRIIEQYCTAGGFATARAKPRQLRFRVRYEPQNQHKHRHRHQKQRQRQRQHQSRLAGVKR